MPPVGVGAIAPHCFCKGRARHELRTGFNEGSSPLLTQQSKRTCVKNRDEAQYAITNNRKSP